MSHGTWLGERFAMASYLPSVSAGRSAQSVTERESELILAISSPSRPRRVPECELALVQCSPRCCA